MERRETFPIRLAYLAIGLLACNTSVAGEWTSEAGVAVGGIYSDNICLSFEDKQSEWVTTATPDIRAQGEGARVNMDLLFSLEFNSLANSSLDCGAGTGGLGFGDKDSPVPRLRFSSDAILVEDWLYFDARAFADQNKINSFGVGGGDNINGRGNTNTNFNYSLSPYISRRISDKISFLLRYTFDEQINSESLLEDSTSQAVLMDFGSDPASSRLSMGVAGSYSKVKYDDRFGGNTINSELSSARFRSSFQLNSQWQVNGYVGEEWNDFVSVFEDTEGTFWDVGLLWTPNERVSVALGTGDRFFGSTPRMDIQYRHKRSTIRASYVRAVTYERNLRGTDQFASDIDGLLDETVSESGDNPSTAGAPTTFTNSPLLDERFTLAYTFRGRRTSINLNASHSEQTRAEDGFTDTFIEMGVSLQRNLSQKLSLISALNWQDREGDENRDGAVGTLGRDSDTWRFMLGLQRALGTNTSASVNYQYNTRASEFVVDEYDENRLTFSLRYQF